MNDPTTPAFLVQYDPEVGEVQTFFDGKLSEAIQVRQSMLEEVTLHAAIEELRRLGYTVTLPTQKPTDVVAWYVTFGIGTPNGHTYTKVFVDSSLPRDEQELAVRHATVMRYGREWALNYPPEQYEKSIERYGLSLREELYA